MQPIKNRQAILNKVKNFWVKGVLERSLHDQVLIELGLEKRSGAVVSLWNLELETADEAQTTLPKGTTVISIFDQLGEGRSLVILGEPGAGKTTTLLELARDLVNRAEQGIDYRIPVVFNLSSWASKKQTIADWLVEELKTLYQVPHKVGRGWIEKQELLLLLDGLDEVEAKCRDSCVAALNAFHQNFRSEMIVTSRIQDYKALSNRLNFQAAIYLRSLTPEQIRYYLDSISTNLTGLRALLKGNRAVQDLAKSPLMLNIMVLAYEGVAVEGLPKTEVVEEWRKQLFDAYIEQMFCRPNRLKVEQRYSPAQSLRWLTWLAQGMKKESQTVFFIERMEPAWLQNKAQKITYRVGNIVLAGLICWLASLLIFVLIGGLIGNLLAGLAGGLIFGLIAGLIGALIGGLSREDIKTVETLKFAWKEVRNNLISRLIVGLIVGVIFGSVIGLSSGGIYGLMIGLIVGLIIGLIIGLIAVLASGLSGRLRGLKKDELIIPNQGIWRSVRNAGIGGLIGGLMGGLPMVLIGGLLFVLFRESGMLLLLSQGLTWVAVISLNAGLSSGLMSSGGEACSQHLTLRLILYRKGYIPWNYARFLDYAAERIFLQKVGGGYIFMHRLLLEHFAQM